MGQRREQIRRTLTEFCDAFNRNDLDGVMAFFTDDGLYKTFEGRERRGSEAIRAEFAPQFKGRYGKMLFDVEDLLIDEEQGRAVLRWTCFHEPAWSGAQSVLRLLFGKRFGWQGLDVFYLEGEKIAQKHTFTRAPLPAVSRKAEREVVPLSGGDVGPRARLAEGR